MQKKLNKWNTLDQLNKLTNYINIFTFGNLKVNTDIMVEAIDESLKPVAHEKINTNISYSNLYEVHADKQPN